ncbi:hypothetical protein QN375_16650 [Pseudomonas sp. MH9.2]|uniref:hypothetical protein n=1 Tax=unclassified Pseudomonas TaxID=196821 RepID=UPI002AC8D89C|nr:MULTISPECIES: hypothetical protein [unclassified Pseudomonas]MEB0027388.1 hypothetical protein [Pseudomonas sp. MH9.2]MEB0148712.1 hypothetical protein [Pseudomonas sp. CCC2.2]MEE3506610.1 hypothetical protein [Pseudomonas sp. 10C3]WPX68806.1 hypothetical protein RHM55_24400 [Pseudomonas sp. MH9.2]
MNKKFLLALVLGGMTINTAWAGTYEWTSGWAQGNTESSVDDGNGNTLNITCPGEDEDEGDVRAYASIAGQEYSSKDTSGADFDVIVDGIHYSNPFETNCDACSSIFPAFWKALRNANNLQISAAGRTVKLPTKNMKKVLLPLDNKENTCRSTW